MAVERFLARQPIFDAKLQVVAYELLFRSDLDNYCKAIDHDFASSTVIADSVLLFDLPQLTGGKGAFVNMSRAGLLAEHARVLPPDLATIEILETIEADEDVVEACRQLAAAGYRLALDDFTDPPGAQPLIDLADCIKIDVLSTPPDRVAEMAHRLRRPGLKLLAEKVETREDFDRNVALGFDLFQGYFFERPVIVSARDVPGFKATYLELLREINREPYDINRVERILKHDVSISYKFLRYINSAAVGLRNRVSSIRETLLLLGVRQSRALASLWTLAGLGQDQPETLLTTSITRARLCEALAPLARMAGRDSELFLTGMLSLIDVIVGRPMETLIAELPVSEAVRQALVEQQGELYPVLDCVMAYERGNWERVSELTSQLGVNAATLPDLYLKVIAEGAAVGQEAAAAG